MHSDVITLTCLQASRAISQRVKGLQHRARAVFSLGNTVFVDSMVCFVTHTFTNQYAGF